MLPALPSLLSYSGAGNFFAHDQRSFRWLDRPLARFPYQHGSPAPAGAAEGSQDYVLTLQPGASGRRKDVPVHNIYLMRIPNFIIKNTAVRSSGMKRSPRFICLVYLLLLIAAGFPIAAATPSITYVSPSSGSYGSTVTVTIHGSGFEPASQVELYRCPSKYGGVSGTGLIYGSITGRTDTTITARFDLSGSQVVGGVYDVVVNNPGMTMAEAAFTVNGGPSSGTTTTPTPTWTTTTPTPTWTTTTTITTTTTTQTTKTAATTAPTGKNSVFFETNPSGASISMSGNAIGTTPFTYYTDKDGTFSVVARKSGYENYEGKVTIIDGQRVRFYGLLTQLSSATTTSTTNPATVLTTSASGKPITSVPGTPVNTSSTIRKSMLKIPTPLGTDPPVTEEAPTDPVIALWAAGIVLLLVVIRRR